MQNGSRSIQIEAGDEDFQRSSHLRGGDGCDVNLHGPPNVVGFGKVNLNSALLPSAPLVLRMN